MTLVIVRYGRWVKVVLGMSIDPMADPKLLEEEEEEIDSAKVKTGTAWSRVWLVSRTTADTSILATSATLTFIGWR